MRDVLSTTLPDEALFPLKEFCQNDLNKDGAESGSSADVLKLVTEYPLLVLLFKDTQLLTSLLKLLNTVGGSDKKGNLAHDLFTNFFHFLVGHCQDHSYFFKPILQVLSSTPGRPSISVVFRSLISRLMSDFAQQEDTGRLVSFIENGGGKLIVDCLVTSCKAPGTSGLTAHNINAIGTKKQLKTISDSSKLVNFLPFASIHCVPSRTLATELTKSGPSRSSTLHHTFNTSEQCLQLNISLPFPILLHCLQLFQPVGITQSGPSSVLIKVSPYGEKNQALPVTPLIQTSGLSSIKVELQHPEIAQEVEVYLGRPFASNSLGLSHMHLLGVAYGNEGVESKDSGPVAVTSREGKDRPRYMCYCTC